MKKQHPVMNKNVGIAAAIGAGLGLVAGGKSQQLVSGLLFGAGVGAIVGMLGNKLDSQIDEEAPHKSNEKAKQENESSDGK